MLNSQANELPWYDDRVATLYDPDPKHLLRKPGEEGPQPKAESCPQNKYDTPRKIYDYLNQHVWKQESAKRAAAIIAYNCLRGIKSNSMFVGPTGCGKTHTWRCLQKIFPDMIEITDGSSITMDGWKGSTKWKDLLCFSAAISRSPAILVIDEADKMLTPKYSSHDENVSHGVQSEGLAMLEGTRLTVKTGPVVHEIDTSKISFVLCGAFSKKAQDIAFQSGYRHVGFGADQPAESHPYARPLDEQDLIDYGVMPEFLGRIQRIVNLERMTADDYYRMTESPNGVLHRIGQQYGVRVRLTPKTRRELAERAYSTGLGIRGMENQIRQLMDDALFADYSKQCFEF